MIRIHPHLAVVVVVVALATGATAVPILSPPETPRKEYSYPTFTPLSPLRLNSTVARLEQTADGALLFASPANDLFDNPHPVPVHAAYRLTNPTEAWDRLVPPAVEQLTDNVLFPNAVRPAPTSWNLASDAVVVCGGRFPAGPSEGLPGHIELIVSPTTAVSLTGPPSDDHFWFYFDMVFEDINGDGYDDILAARQKDIAPGVFWNQLIWVEHPGTVDILANASWTVHVLVNADETPDVGPSTSFDFADVDGDGAKELVFVQFWTQYVGLMWSSSGDWTDSTSLHSTIVTKDIGNAYGAEFADVNNDGRLDIIATNHAQIGDVIPPTVAVFEIPEDFRTASSPVFVEHIIDTDFPDRWKPGMWAVGFARHFYPADVSPGDVKPMLVATGDGGGAWWLYTPASQYADDWTFTRQTLHVDECDFIAPAFYQENDDAVIIMAGCLGQRIIYAGVLA